MPLIHSKKFKQPIIMKNLLTLCFLFLGCSLIAQVTKTVHQTFEIEEEVVNVALDIYDEFVVEEWAGNNIMVVTKIELTSGAQHLLDFYVKEGRYNLESSGEDTALSLVSKDNVRRGMKYKDLTVYETVKMKLYIPENFQLNGDSQLVKKVEEVVENDQ